MKLRLKTSIIHLFLTLTFIVGGAFASEKKRKPVKLFRSDTVLKVKIQSNFPHVNLPNSSKYSLHAATLAYFDEKKNSEIELPVRLSARGGGRLDWCDFAPIMLHLPEKKKNNAGVAVENLKKKTLFNKAKKKMKMITHCNPNSYTKPELFHKDDFVITEYVLYKIVEASGLPAFKTRLATIDYYSNNGELFDSGYAIFLENSKDMAQRNGAVDWNPIYRFNEQRVAYDISLRLAYSEIDHEFHRGDNSKAYIKLDENGKPIISTQTQVPYDFVYSPDYFPYQNTKAPSLEGNWFDSYEKQYPRLKNEIKKNVQIVVDNSARILKAIDDAPYGEGSSAKIRVRTYITDLLSDAREYISK